MRASQCEAAMLNIFTVLLPIFLVMAVGYFFTRHGVFHREGLMALGRFVISIALPALIFKTLAEKPIADIIIPPYLFGYALASLVCFASGLAVSLWAGALRPLSPRDIVRAANDAARTRSEAAGTRL